MLANYIAMQLKERTLADVVAEFFIENASALNDGERPSETLFGLIECAAADPDRSRGQKVLSRRLETLAFVVESAHLPDVYDTLRVGSAFADGRIACKDCTAFSKQLARRVDAFSPLLVDPAVRQSASGSGGHLLLPLHCTAVYFSRSGLP
jgi:hypothetical protein